MRKIIAFITAVSLILSMVGNVIFAAANTFPDTKDHWAEDAIKSLYEQGIVKGYPDGTVRPDSIITRAEFVSLITHSMKLEGYKAKQTTPYFSDIYGLWAESYINALVENKVIDTADYANKKYNPDEPITRIEIIKMVINSLGLQAAATTQKTGYKDDALLSALDRGYVNLADKYGITFGYPDNTMKPTEKSTRAEAFTLLVRRTSALVKIESEKQQPPTTTVGSGGGGYSYPRAEVEFEIPDYTHTDQTITITTTNKNAKTLVWQVEKWNDETIKFEVCDIEHALTIDGGDIRFPDDGKYQLTAVSTNMGNTKYKFSKQITVFPVADVAILLSADITHTDTPIDISLGLVQNIDDYDVVWAVSKDDESADYYCKLEKNGGSLLLSEKGNYAITATLTDKVERTFETTTSVKVYPIHEIALALPTYAYINEDIAVTTEARELGALPIDWIVSKDGDPIEYAGQLTNDGGTITLTQNGDYTVTASVTDETGRTFEYSETMRIYAIPKVEFGTFGLPSYAHTDTNITITPELTDVGNLTIDWLISKDDGEEKPYTAYVTGTLNNGGGTVRFLDKGSYTLTAKIMDEVGTIYTFTSKTTIYPLPTVAFELPINSHTDKTITVTPITVELGNLNIIWNISRNGDVAANYTNYVVGTLSNNGGDVRFTDKGEYTLIATIIDEVGRAFEYSASTKIYPVPIIDFTTNGAAEFALPQYSYTDKNITIIPRNTDLGILNVVWTVAKDNNTPRNYTTYMHGNLSNEGGNIIIPNVGNYTLLATVTDEIGRAFTYSSMITILPIQSIDFDIANVVYADEFVSVSTVNSFENVSWTISKDGGSSTNYTVFTNGALTSTGGEVAFTSKGNYNVTMTATDAGGRKYTVSKIIKVYPTPQVNVTLSDNAYIGDKVLINTILSDMGNLNISWYASKNSELPKNYLTYASGTLSNSGGSLNFTDEGEYTLIARVTDALGKTFEYTSNIICVYPLPTVDFTLPTYAHTDTTVSIETTITNIENDNIAWTINKDDVDASQCIVGELINGGGNITFTKSGDYTLTATLTDSTGREFTTSKSIKIYDVVEMVLSAPENGHVDKNAKIILSLENSDNSIVNWTIAKDGAAPQNYVEYVDGTLTNDGGSVCFTDKGNYTVIATVTDATGRTYESRVNITIYPLPNGGFDLPETSHTDKTIEILTAFTDVNSTVVWTVSKDNGADKLYTDYAVGSLIDEGGSINFSTVGTYKLTATVTDNANRTFTFSKQIQIYPVPNITLEMPTTAHTDTTAKITTNITSADNLLVDWTISKDGATAANYVTYADGVLNYEGGSVKFVEKGTYTVYGTATDKTGRKWTVNKTIIIYPTSSVALAMPGNANAESAVAVTTALTDISGSIVWTASKDGGAATNYSTYASGNLTNSGGSITFTSGGHYTLTATFTDATGRKFTASKSIEIYNNASITLTAPTTGYIDTAVKVLATVTNADNVVWTISKDGNAPQNYVSFVTGTFTNDGGNIMFTDKGEYVITATVTDKTGQKIEASKKITISPVPTIAFTLPSYAHTDTTVSVETTVSNIENGSVAWIVNKDGGDASQYVVGELINGGGNITFTKGGDYTLTATLNDSTGRVFTASKTIKIYDVVSMTLSAPENGHIDKNVKVVLSIQNNNSIVNWTISKDSAAPQNYVKYVDGTLTNDGGSVCFTDKGAYTVIATATDATGRTYESRVNITIYTLPTGGFDLPETSHTDKTIEILTAFTNVSSTVVWTVSKDNGADKPYTDCAVGTLTDEGGSINFSTVGTYKLTATVTDDADRTFTFSKQIQIYPVANISLDAPTTVHTDTTAKIITNITNTDNLIVDWTISKDGAAATNYVSYVDGALNYEGGTVKFVEKGTYIVYGTATDKTGRKWTVSKTIVVYPTSSILLSMPENTNAGSAVTVTTSLTEIGGTIVWTASKDGGTATNYSTYASGTLNNSGGNLTFANGGNYTLIATYSDTTGRKFTASKSIAVYNTASITLNMPTTGHNDTSVKVLATISNAESVVWTIAKDGNSAQNYVTYVTGTLANDGGNILFADKGTYIITATATDKTGKKTEVSKTINIYSVQTIKFTLPTTAYTDTALSVVTTLSNVTGTIAWTVSKDGGTATNYTTYISGTLANSGGNIRFTSGGNFVLNGSITDISGRKFEYSQSITVYPIPTVTVSLPNSYYIGAPITITTNPVNLGSLAVIWSLTKDGVNVNLNEYTTNNLTKNGGSITFKTAGNYTLTAAITNEQNRVFTYSSSTTIAYNNPPTTPVITRTPNTNSIAPNTPVTISALSTDPDGHSITYMWEGRPSQTSVYPLGKNVVKVKAADSYGAESAWTAIVFFVADAVAGGGMTLETADSVIIENGIEGATITSYTFTVPPVVGHSGSDYGRVRGFNIRTNQWEEIDYITTTNGITMSKTLEAGKYSKLEFYYYTNHNCMYGKSNITYSVEYFFADDGE